MKAAIIENGTVVNIARVNDEAFAADQGWVVSDRARVGDRYDAATGTFVSPPVAAVEPPAGEVTREDLRAELSRVHDAYRQGTTAHRGVEIRIDLEARVNARDKLDELLAGAQPLPFTWFATGEALTIDSVEAMRALYEAILTAQRRGFAAKAKVLAAIDGIENTAEYDVGVAFRAHL
ncbi:hypothetical protein [Halomonas organivorans]|uniref:DUF4376 domain-containing protein n=1 Tax=Halomonas organivorans TaxID=257772 RepID=A0A7W5C1R2_9GAMM|nr:hypothetical protein [Halomonas organivorans]MBB3142183.1 hypothetical protein [Halomonas organivorans]